MPDFEMKRDRQTVNPDGESLERLPAGVSFYDVPLQIDERGSVRELFDPRWNWHPEPVVFTYLFTIRPGFVKGSGLHKQHEDRYFVISGEMLAVLYDERPDSPTFGLVSQVVLSEFRGRLMNIPAGIWHADPGCQCCQARTCAGLSDNVSAHGRRRRGVDLANQWQSDCRF